MIAVALWVASLPGAVGRMAAFGIGPLLLGSAGLVVLCLLKIAAALAGVALLVVASLWAVRAPQPDVLIAADGLTLRGARRRRPARDRARRQRHLRRPAVARRRRRCARAHRREPRRRHSLRRRRLHRPACRTARWSRWRARIEAFEEDCRRAAVVASARDAPARLRGAGDRPQRAAPDRRGRAAAHRRGLRDDGGHGRRATTGPGRRRRAVAGEQRRPHTGTRARRRAMPRRGRRTWSRAIEALSTAGTGRPSCPGCARGWAAGCAPHRRCWRARARSRRRGGGSA